MQPYGIIYKVIFKPTNEVVYVGQTIRGMETRKQQHIDDSFNENRIEKVPFHCAIRKYGVDAFEWQKQDDGYSKEGLNAKEIYWIMYFGTLIKYGKGYNCTKGGNDAEHTKKSVVAIDAINGYEYYYESLTSAFKSTGVNQVNITQNLKGENMVSGGYIWRCATPKEDEMNFQNGELIGVDESIDVLVKIEQGKVVEIKERKNVFDERFYRKMTLKDAHELPFKVEDECTDVRLFACDESGIVANGTQTSVAKELGIPQYKISRYMSKGVSLNGINFVTTDVQTMLDSLYFDAIADADIWETFLTM